MADTFYSMNPLAEVLEALPAEEIQHMRRVGRLVDCFARKLKFRGLSGECLDGSQYFGNAAFYHDIDKAWIPSGILAKSGKLTEQEFFRLRGHPLFAQRLFHQLRADHTSGMPDLLLQLASDSAIYHHEWWDGGGYPYGFKHGAIPLIARVTAICDAYDAITSDRVYRKRHSQEFACQELRQYAGTQFDPELVKAFLAAGTDGTPFHDALCSRL